MGMAVLLAWQESMGLRLGSSPGFNEPWAFWQVVLPRRALVPVSVRWRATFSFGVFVTHTNLGMPASPTWDLCQRLWGLWGPYASSSPYLVSPGAGTCPCYALQLT